jgi:hypothetical protein
MVVVGDDKQISPYNVGITREDIFTLREKYLDGIPHADTLGLDNSLFDVADIRFGGRITLREHFRCMPEIIRFSNDLSYNGRLVPLRQNGSDRLDPVYAVRVPDGYQKGDLNPPEADAIVEQILACCADPRYDGKSLGVISLRGDKQAKAIELQLLKRLDPRELERRRIVCGDAYAFQGDERDIIFLSLVTAPRDDGKGFRARTSAADQRLFNVAASRARDQLWLFHSVELDDLPNPDDLRRRLLHFCLNLNPFSSTGRSEDTVACDGPFDSPFERVVCERISARGYRVTPQVRVGPYRIDLVVEGTRGRLAVECDGDRWHGPEQFDRDMARQRVLERSGWVFWRVRGGATSTWTQTGRWRACGRCSTGSRSSL